MSLGTRTVDRIIMSFREPFKQHKKIKIEIKSQIIKQHKKIQIKIKSQIHL